MWTFARSFLASFDGGVISGFLDHCYESNNTGLLQGGKFLRFEREHGEAAAEPSQVTDIVLRFLSNFQEDNVANDLDQPVEDFKDDLYSLPTSAVIPDFSYFN
jgi:hypothetical protein